DGEAEVLGAGIGGAGGVGAVNLAFDRVQVLGAAALRGRSCQDLGQAEDERAGVERVDHVRDGAAQGRPARRRTTASSVNTSVSPRGTARAPAAAFSRLIFSPPLRAASCPSMRAGTASVST